MFLGYQLKKIGEEVKNSFGEDGALISVVVDITEPFISYIAETREELESMPCVEFDRIEETDKTYFLHNGEYVCEVPFDQQVEEVRQIRENLYREQKDPITCQIQSLRDEEQTEEVIAEIEALKIKRAEIVAEIKENNPYPVE